MSYDVDDGSKVMRIKMAAFVTFDLFNLKRKDAANDYDAATIIKQQTDLQVRTARKVILQRNIIAGFPGHLLKQTKFYIVAIKLLFCNSVKSWKQQAVYLSIELLREKQLNALLNMGIISSFVGLITSSRSFLSYSRHEYFRRVLCNLLGEPKWKMVFCLMIKNGLEALCKVFVTTTLKNTLLLK